MNGQLGVVRRLGKGAGDSEQGEFHATGAPTAQRLAAGISDSSRSDTEAIRFHAEVAGVCLRNSCPSPLFVAGAGERSRFVAPACVNGHGFEFRLAESRNRSGFTGLMGRASIKGLLAKTSKVTALLQGITSCRG